MTAPLPQAFAKGPHALACLALALLVYVAFLPALGAGFVWLDHFEVEDGALIVTSWSQVTQIFFDDGNFGGYHRPIYNLLHSLDSALFGLNPSGHHLTSVLLHALNAVLFLSLLRSIRVRLWIAFLAALLWAVHPVNAPTAGLIHAKADLFVTTALLATGLLIANAVDRSSRTAWFAAAALFVVAALTKELAFVFPIGLTLLAWKEPRVRALCVALWIITLSLVGLRLLGAANTVHESALGLGERLATFSVVLGTYLRDLVFPHDLAFADTVTRWSVLPLGERIRYGVVLLFFVLAQVRVWRTRPELRKWIVAFDLALLPVAQIVPILHFRADRFLYLPSLALLGFAAQAGSALVEKQRKAAVLIATGLVLAIGLCSFETRARLRTFETDETLFTAAIARTPDYLEGLSALAYYHDRNGQPQTAEAYYGQCLVPRPGRISYLERGSFVVNYSNNLLRLGRPGIALVFLEDHASWTVRARHIEEARYNRAVALVQLGRFEEALPHFTAYSQQHPADASTRYLLGRCAFELGDDELATESFEAYLELAPDAKDRDEVARLLAELSARRQ